MLQVDLGEATAALPALVAQVEAGDEVVLMREGRAVARIVATEGEKVSELTAEERVRAREALAGIRALAERLSLGPFDMEEFRRDRDQGRL